MGQTNTTPARLIIKLVTYFSVLIGLIAISIAINPDYINFLPFGGSDAIDRGEFEITQSRLSVVTERADESGRQLPTPDLVWRTVLFLGVNLLATVLVMIPVSWTYLATRWDDGPSKTYVRSLLILPICASTVVLLIQDSLALAFGLAALVAAVRFRVALSEAIDGIYIFAAISVGLAGGIGYLGIAAIMAMFFCLTHATLWALDYGQNPIDEKRLRAKREKLDDAPRT